MANVLSKSNISNSNIIEAWQVSQSVDAFTATTAYDIAISGSLTVTGPTNIVGSVKITGSTNVSGSVDIAGGDLNTRGFSNATASWATNVVNAPSDINRYILPSGSVPSLFSTQMIAGASLISSGTSINTVDITPINFAGKILGTDVFVTVGISSSYSTSSMSFYPKVDSIGPNSVTFTTQTNTPFNVPFFFTIVYRS